MIDEVIFSTLLNILIFGSLTGVILGLIWYVVKRR